MVKKSYLALLSGAFAVSAALGACSDSSNDGQSAPDATAAETSQTEYKEDAVNSIEVTHDIKDDNKCTVDIGDDLYITGTGASYENNILSITEGGTYTLSGSVSDGYIYIDCDENVKLVLNGVTVRNSSGSALYCYNAKNLYIELGEGSENYFEDGGTYSFEGKNQSSADNEPNAAIYSKSDMFIYGGGSLNVKGNYGLAIRCNDDLTIEQGTVTAEAKTNGIRGSDSVTVSGGVVTVNAEKDGIKTTNDTDAGKGNILISGGRVNVTAGEDGIQAAEDLEISGGEIEVTTTGDVEEGGIDNWRSSDAGDETTSKGIKSTGAMSITGGKITVNSTDHCIHSAAELQIANGEITLSSSKGKGISAHGDLTVDGGSINVLNSTEGVESKAVFTVNGGEIIVTARDDGLNSGGGSDMMRGSGSSDSSSDSHDMFINGGYIYIDAAGDGIDSNGNITVNGGTVIVNGPTNGGNGALDCGDRNNSITVNGGFLIAAGSLQMAENPSLSSEQNSIGAQVSLNAGETVALTDPQGNNVVVFTVAKQVQHIVISSPDIISGESYRLYTGVSAEGDEKNGLYENTAALTIDGDPLCTLTIESSVTTYGQGGNGGFGGPGHGGNPGGPGGFGGFPGGR